MTEKLKVLSLSDLDFIIKRFSSEASLDWKYGKGNKRLYDAVQKEIERRIEFIKHT